jgi:hypothetical protein
MRFLDVAMEHCQERAPRKRAPDSQGRSSNDVEQFFGAKMWRTKKRGEGG